LRENQRSNCGMFGIVLLYVGLSEYRTLRENLSLRHNQFILLVEFCV
jgi:hypothetical protein